MNVPAAPTPGDLKRIGGGVTVNAGELFEIARAAYERTGAASSDREQLRGDPLIAIIFSAAALEAFINEAARLASLRPDRVPELPPESVGILADLVEKIEKSNEVEKIKKAGGSFRITIPGSEPPSVRAFADVVEEIEKLRGSIQLKFLLGRVIFVGEAYDKGAQPYQDFDLLMDLRGALLHLKVGGEFEIGADGEIRRKHPPIIDRLRSKNILAEIEEPAASLVPLTRLVSTRAAARWACTTAVKMVASVIEVVPVSELKEGLDRFYSKSFRQVQ